MPDSLSDIGLKFGSGKFSGHSYATVYEQLLGPLRDQPIRLCELGVLHGESMAAWLEYGHAWQVVGVDAGEITPCPEPARQPELTRALACGRFTFFQCPVHEPRAANLLRAESCDIIIDDASHDPDQQVAALDNFWPALKTGGLYFVEDVYSSRTLPRLHEWAVGHGAAWRVSANFQNCFGEFRDDDILVILRKP
jgi:cephalosporin hydroxylase